MSAEKGEAAAPERPGAGRRVSPYAAAKPRQADDHLLAQMRKYAG